MEGSLSVALHASWAVDNLAPAEALAAGRVAKAYCARAARTVCETAIQVHGGIGNTWECIVHVYLRRALLSSQWFGDDGVQLACVAARATRGRGLMDFRDSPAEAEFRGRLRAWLAANNPGLPASSTDDEYWARQAEWHTALYDAGFFGLSWPARFGGHDLPTVFDVILDEELAAAGAPPRPSLGYLVQGIGTHGSDAIKDRFLPGLISGRERWCQGFSEPDAGSDLAVAAHDRDARRRRVRDRRSQDLDELLRRRRLVHPARAHRSGRAEAQGPVGVRGPDAPTGHRATAAADDQRHHQRVRSGAVRRRACRGREHDRRARRRLAPRDDDRQPRTRTGRARLRRALREDGEGARTGRCAPIPTRSATTSARRSRGRTSRPRCSASTCAAGSRNGSTASSTARAVPSTSC